MAEITQEQTALAAIQVLSNKQTLEQAKLPQEMTEAVRDFIISTFGINNAQAQVGEAEATDSKHIDAADFIRQLNLESQHGERFDTLKHFGFLTENSEAKEGDVQPPSFEKAMSTFKPEELEIASEFQRPTLILIPETSFAAKVKALDAHKQGEQKNDTYADEFYTDSDSGSDQITGWRAVIVDGTQEMKAHEGDNFHLRFDERVKNRKSWRKPGEKGMDRHKYILLMMEAIRNGNPDDKELYVLLEDELASSSRVPFALFNPVYRRVDFSLADPDSIRSDARLRSSVGGDVLLS